MEDSTITTSSGGGLLTLVTYCRVAREVPGRRRQCKLLQVTSMAQQHHRGGVKKQTTRVNLSLMLQPGQHTIMLLTWSSLKLKTQGRGDVIWKKCSTNPVPQETNNKLITIPEGEDILKGIAVCGHCLLRSYNTSGVGFCSTSVVTATQYRSRECKGNFHNNYKPWGLVRRPCLAER